MKKLFTIICLCFTVLTASSQSTSPRFGTAKNQDNTARSLTYKTVTGYDDIGADTVKLALNAFETFVRPTSIIDSLTYRFNSVSNCYLGDKAIFTFTNSGGSGHKIKFVSTNCEVGSSGYSITLTASKRATIVFLFDGVKWIELHRLVQ